MEAHQQACPVARVACPRADCLSGPSHPKHRRRWPQPNMGIPLMRRSHRAARWTQRLIPSSCMAVVDVDPSSQGRFAGTDEGSAGRATSVACIAIIGVGGRFCARARVSAATSLSFPAVRPARYGSQCARGYTAAVSFNREHAQPPSARKPEPRRDGRIDRVRSSSIRAHSTGPEAGSPVSKELED